MWRFIDAAILLRLFSRVNQVSFNFLRLDLYERAGDEPPLIYLSMKKIHYVKKMSDKILKVSQTPRFFIVSNTIISVCLCNRVETYGINSAA